MFIGLSYADGGLLYTSINYSWYIYPTGSSYVFENGTQMYSNHTAYVPGTTTWRIARTGGNIVYYKNGVAVRTVAETNANAPMVVDITIWNTGTVDKAKVHNLKVGKLQFVVATYAIGDYVPYVHSDYRFGYNGMEKDPEMKGDGNSLDYGARQYDPRLGRWFTQDPLAHAYPSASPYCYALNTPIGAKDADGRYTIFVCGYIYGKYPGPWDDIEPNQPYWRQSDDDPEEYINAAHSYLGDGLGGYVNGTGDDIASMAWTRQDYGREVGEELALAFIEYLKTEEGKKVKEINFVSHSMGAATAEGIIEEFMKHPELAALMKKGEIVHFSACDANDIKISKNSRRLKRTQLNYKGDGILAIGDPGSQATGGYQIPGVKRFGVVNADLEKLHPWIYNNDKDWEFHHDTKAFKEAWDFVKILDRRLLKNPKLIGSPVYINCDELEGIDSPIKSEGEATEQPSQNHG